MVSSHKNYRLQKYIPIPNWSIILYSYSSYILLPYKISLIKIIRDRPDPDLNLILQENDPNPDQNWDILIFMLTFFLQILREKTVKKVTNFAGIWFQPFRKNSDLDPKLYNKVKKMLPLNTKCYLYFSMTTVENA